MKKYHTLTQERRCTLHADIGLGLIVATLICRMCGVEATYAHALVGIVFALLPDLDVISELKRMGKVAAHAGNVRDHREGLHYPLALVLVSGLGIYLWLGPVFGLIAAVAVFLHFVHDSFGTGWGVKWLWPFSMKNFKFFCEKNNQNSLNPVVSWTPEELRVAITKYGDPDWMRKYVQSLFFALEVFVFFFGLSLWIFSHKTP